MALPTDVKSRKSIDRGAYVQNKDVVSVIGARKISFDDVRRHIWGRHPELKSRAAKWTLWFLADFYAEHEMAPKTPAPPAK